MCGVKQIGFPDPDTVKEKVERAADTVKEKAHEAGDAAKENWEKAKGNAEVLRFGLKSGGLGVRGAKLIIHSSEASSIFPTALMT